MNNKERSEESDVLKLLLINIYLIFLCLCTDIIEEVIEQQSTLFENVTIVANFFKYEEVGQLFVRHMTK